MNSLGVVLGQEMQRFNKLLERMAASLHQLTKALKVIAIFAASPCCTSACELFNMVVVLLLCTLAQPCESATTIGQCCKASSCSQVCSSALAT